MSKLDDELKNLSCWPYYAHSTNVWQSTTYLLTGGAEKILRIFDLNRPDAPPTEIDGSPGTIRAAVWHHSDQTILSSSNDTGGIK